MLIRQADLKDN